LKVLATVIANLQNVPPAETRPPMVVVDRGGGGGPLWSTRYDFADIMTAVQLFPEIAGEDSALRVVRRLRWIAEALPQIKDAREKREAVVFLAGAVVGDAAAEERHRATVAAEDERRSLADQLKIEQLVTIIDEVRGAQQPVEVPVRAPRSISRGRGSDSGASPFAILAALGVGVGIWVAVSKGLRQART
jgi:hypothetical protein